MRPRPPCFDRADGRSTNVIISRYVFVQPVVRTDSANIISGQARPYMHFPSGSSYLHSSGMFVGRHIPSPRHSVCRILTMRSPSQMTWVYARRIVARMKRALVHRRGPTIDRERYARSYKRYSFNPIPMAQSAIAARILTPGPFPTCSFGAYNDLSPKSGLQTVRNFWQRDGSHSKFTFRCGQGRALLKQRFRPAFYSRFTICSQRETAV